MSATHDSDPCPFCIGASVAEDPKRLVLHRARFNFVIMNLFPYTPGHLMVVPYAHISSIEDMSPDQMNEMMALSARSVRLLQTEYGPRGFNLGLNLGECAGGGVRDHLHLHVVPRWCGDSNFMTSTGETRMLPESLDSSYEKLRPLFDEAVPGAL